MEVTEEQSLALFVVLILIIMEDTHGASVQTKFFTSKSSLNPYYNGRYSWSNNKTTEKVEVKKS